MEVITLKLNVPITVYSKGGRANGRTNTTGMYNFLYKVQKLKTNFLKVLGYPIVILFFLFKI